MSKIIRFNTDRKPWFEFKNAADKSVDLFIYDEIGFWGTTANDFVTQLSQLEVEHINLHINSPGGSVFDGVAIYNALKKHEASIDVFIDGLAASIASIIAMAGDTIEIASNAMIMIHKPTVLMWGTAEDLRREASVLDKIEGTLVDTYAERTAGDREQIQEWMNAETWFNADEALEHGFADKKTEAKKAAASLIRWDLSLFENPPDVPEETEDKTEKVTPLSLLLRRQALIEKILTKE